jgi:hypothetical protein
MSDPDAQLEALLARHYYSEEWELQAAFLAWLEEMSPTARQAAETAFTRRVTGDPGSMENTSLAAALPLPALAEPLAAALDAQPEPSQLTRSLLCALSRQSGSTRAFAAVERWVDSSQEMEALRALAAIDFARARGQLRQAMLRDELLETCLHLFADRARRDGLPALLADLDAIAGSPPEWIRPRLEILCRRIKPPDAMPLPPDACAAILARFALS